MAIVVAWQDSKLQVHRQECSDGAERFCMSGVTKIPEILDTSCKRPNRERPCMDGVLWKTRSLGLEQPWLQLLRNSRWEWPQRRHSTAELRLNRTRDPRIDRSHQE